MILVMVIKNLFDYMYLHSFEKYLNQISNLPATCGVYVKPSYVEMIHSLPEDRHGRHNLKK